MNTLIDTSLVDAVLVDTGQPLGHGSGILIDLPDVASGSNPLVEAANPVLNLVPQIRKLHELDDLPRLRSYLIDHIKTFEKDAQRRGIPADAIIGARYCLCTLLDETAAQTPWGGSGAWSTHSLLVAFHNETWGGEKFFQLLSKLAQSPQQHHDLLALMYYCLCLGFEGRFRIVDNGRALLETLRQRLWNILRDAGPEQPETLSPHWRGEVDPRDRGWRLLPAWVVACVALMIGIFAFLWFSFTLAAHSDKVFEQIAAVRLTQKLPPPQSGPERFGKFLESEVKEGLVVVRNEADRNIVVMRGDGLFASGSAVVKDGYLHTLQRIAEALNAVKGQVLVNGYTDDIPIRTARYPSNYQLSKDRAEQVKKILVQYLHDPSRITAQGFGESDPLVANDSAENRARNRRVVVVLLAAPKIGHGE